MTLSICGRSGDVPSRTTYPGVGRSDNRVSGTAKADIIIDVEVVNLKRRIVSMERLIADFDRVATDLGQAIRVEEDRVKNYDPGHFAYPTYAKATALRRDNLRRSADELRSELAKAKTALVRLETI
jgi:hypothetical protein